MSTGPVFSPTQTKAFIRDPAAWYLSYVMKWRPRFIGKKELAGFLGSAFADGAAAYHNGLSDSNLDFDLPAQEVLLKKAAAVAIASVTESKEQVVRLGQSVYEDQSESWELLEKRAAEMVFKYALNMPAHFHPSNIIASELTLPNHGHCRIDLVINTDTGPTVVDFKTSLSLDAKYQAMRLREYEADWQMYHYVWAYQDYLQANCSQKAEHGNPCQTDHPVRRFAILLLVLEPKSRLPVLHPVVVDPELMQIWVQSATQVWKAMHGIRTGQPYTLDPIPWCSFNFFSKFGREDWADAIQKFHMDENLLSVSYVKEITKNA